MLVLGIESSCDETAAAVLQDGNKLLSNVIASQIRIHEKYGGVVPEIASRKHVEVIVPVVLEALERAGVTLDAIEGISVTRGPGLVGSLLVGLSMAKALSMARGIPFVGVNHLEGHVASAFLAEDKPAFPFVALVVSGGHTNIYVVEDFGRMRLVGQTRDDAAGEAFDKAAKLLDIGYPGGVVIDRLAKTGNPSAVSFPRSMKDSLEFSFSGVKTALLTYTKKLDRPPARGRNPGYRGKLPGSHRGRSCRKDAPCGRNALHRAGGRCRRCGRKQPLEDAISRGCRKEGDPGHHPAARILHGQCRHDRRRGPSFSHPRQERRLRSECAFPLADRHAIETGKRVRDKGESSRGNVL